MKIAIIGAGNVGSALAKGWVNAGHEIFLGLRSSTSEKATDLIEYSENIRALSIREAIAQSEVVLFSTPPDVAVKITQQFPELADRIIIDATNSVFKKPELYRTAFEGIQKSIDAKDIVKCFNSTGFENMNNPQYGNSSADMFVAGSSKKAKNVAIQLAKDIGFAECYDFGGDDKVELIEQLAMCWINLAIIQKQGREIAFKILRR